MPEIEIQTDATDEQPPAPQAGHEQQVVQENVNIGVQDEMAEIINYQVSNSLQLQLKCNLNKYCKMSHTQKNCQWKEILLQIGRISSRSGITMK